MSDGFTGGEQLLKTDAGDRAQPALRKLEGGSGGRLSLAKLETRLCLRRCADPSLKLAQA